MELWMTEAIHGFLHNRAEVERTGKARDTYRDALRAWLLEDGREDENGHRYLDFDEPLTVGGRTWSGICAQRRLSSAIDLDATEELAKSKNLLDLVFPVVSVREFDEDALYAANQRGLITDDELDGLLTENVTYAVVPVKS